MKAKIRRAIWLFALVVGVPCWGQTYPEKPIRLVVPYTPGGGADILARGVANSLGESLGWRILIDNRSGAGGNLGAEIVAKAPPDGYTVLFGHTGPLAVNPHLYKRIGYDPLSDFSPVILIGSTYNLLVVHPQLPVRSVKDLIALAKRRPTDLNYASAGVGSGSFLAAELFKSMARITISHVPYKGNAPALLDVLGGRVPVMFPSIVTAARYVQAGKVRALGVTTQTRLTDMPDVPAVSETLPEYEASVWYGIVAPSATPQHVVATLNDHVRRILQPEAVKKRMADQGVALQAGTVDEFATFMRSEFAKWGRVVRASAMQVE